jgi:hypothetical protein
MSVLEKTTVGSIEMDWHADTRLAVLRFTREAHPSGKEAVALVEALTRWIGTDGRTFGLLGDGEKLSGVDAEYRSVWGTFFRQHRRESYIAFFNMKPVIRIAAEMFRIGTGVQLKAFADETDARSWLRQKGIPA